MSMIFPVIPSSVPAAQPAETIGRVPVFDFENQRFPLVDGTPRECRGREAVAQWFRLMLRQRVDAVPIYRTGRAERIGIDLDLLSGRLPADLAAAEIQRNVEETASYNPAVRAVTDFHYFRSGRNRTISFTAVLHDGSSTEVTANV